MDVGITTLRADLKRWLDEARSGEEVVITDRGVPVARLVGIASAPILQRLQDDGVIDLPRSGIRPKATGRKRAASKKSVSELVSAQRD